MPSATSGRVNLPSNPVTLVSVPGTAVPEVAPMRERPARRSARTARMSGAISVILAPLILAGPMSLGVSPAWAADKKPAGTAATWQAECPEGPRGRFCAVTALPPYAENRGGRGRISVTLRRDAECTSLHVGFDRRIDVTRPVHLRVDDGPARAFYTSRQLNDLARAVDEGASAAVGTADGHVPEFSAFLQEIGNRRLASSEAASELLARFAHVKDSQRLGIACPAAERLIPELLKGRTLRLSFHLAPVERAQPYHWPAFDRREVAVPLDELAGILASLPRFK